MIRKNNDKDKIKGKEILLKRTLPGRLAAKKMGKLGRRPKKLNTEKKALVQKLYDNPKITIENICKILKISKPTFYAYLRDRHTT